MSTVSFTRKRGQKFRFSDEERARLKILTDEQALAGARADPDNPPLDEHRLQRMWLAREVRLLRKQTGLSQAQFAVEYQIGLGRLRDYEQARSTPDFAMMAYLKVIAEFPKIADEIVKKLKAEGVPA